MRKLLPGPRLRRGLFRLWLVVAVVWLSVVAIALRGEWPRDAPRDTALYLREGRPVARANVDFLCIELLSVLRSDQKLKFIYREDMARDPSPGVFRDIGARAGIVIPLSKAQWESEEWKFTEALKHRESEYWWRQLPEYCWRFAYFALLPLLALAAVMVVVPIAVKWVALGFAEPGKSARGQ